MTPTPLSSPQGSPGNAAAGGGSLSDFGSVMGVQQGQQPSVTDNARELRKAQMRTVGQQIQQITETLNGIARQFPDVSREVQAMQQMGTAVLVKIAGAQSPESQPPTGALG